MKTLEILVPVYNEEKSLPIFWKRLMSSVEVLKSNYQITIFFLNNNSEDSTLEVIENFKYQGLQVRWVTYASNIGYQNSILGGLRLSDTDISIIIDSDGEDPPELISNFVRGFESGFDIVYGKRSYSQASIIMKFLRRVFYKVMIWTADFNVIDAMAEFGLISRRCREFVVESCANNGFPFLRAEIARSGLRSFGVPYSRQPRISGHSNYNFWRSSKFAVAAFLTSSTLPLRFLGIIGIPLAVLHVILVSIFHQTETSSMLIYFYISSSLSFICLYVARLYSNQLSRPRLLIDKNRSNFEER